MKRGRKKIRTVLLTLGSFDGAELCELIGIYIQSLLADSIELITKENIGLYRGDRLILFRNSNSQQTDRLRKRIIKKFQSIGFKIEIVTNLQEVFFFFFLSGFSFTNVHDSRDSRGRGRVSI